MADESTPGDQDSGVTSSRRERWTVALFLALTVGLALGGFRTIELYQSATAGVPSVTGQQVADAGGVAVFTAAGSGVALTSISADFRPGEVARGRSSSSGMASLDSPYMAIFMSFDRPKDRVEPVVLALWGDARLDPNTIEVGGFGYDLPYDVYAAEMPPVGEDRCPPTIQFSGRVDDPVDRISGAGSSPLQLIYVEYVQTSDGVSISGGRVGSNLISAGGETTVAFPSLQRNLPSNDGTNPSFRDAFYQPLCGNDPLARVDQSDGELERFVTTARAEDFSSQVQAGIVDYQLELTNSAPLTLDNRSLTWIQDGPSSLAPYVRISDTQQAKQKEVNLFIAGALVGVLGGIGLEWAKLIPAASVQTAGVLRGARPVLTITMWGARPDISRKVTEIRRQLGLAVLKGRRFVTKFWSSR